MRPVARLAEDDRGAPSSRADLVDARADGQVVLRDPTPVELVWLEELRVHLRAPEVDLTSVPDLSRLFDSYCLTWHQRAAGERWDPNYVITAIGVALGDVLVARSRGQACGARWMVAAGQATTTVAVRNDQFRRTVFPVDAVARRWISAETGWIDAFLRSADTAARRSTERRRATGRS